MDVVHSMDIAAAVGTERLREIMADLADHCAAVVQRYGGTVDKFTGDGIMALFGAPVALKDHAVRACLAALDVQKETKRLAVEVKRRDGTELRLRVGLNSGAVIAGEIGSGASTTGPRAAGEPWWRVGVRHRLCPRQKTCAVCTMLGFLACGQKGLWHLQLRTSVTATGKYAGWYGRRSRGHTADTARRPRWPLMLTE
jgi:adenylate/guanylate cyclase family protein